MKPQRPISTGHYHQNKYMLEKLGFQLLGKTESRDYTIKLKYFDGSL